MVIGLCNWISCRNHQDDLPSTHYTVLICNTIRAHSIISSFTSIFRALVTLYDSELNFESSKLSLQNTHIYLCASPPREFSYALTTSSDSK